MVKLSRHESQKIKVLSFLLILMVLYIHNGYIESSTFPFALFIQEFLGYTGIGVVANSLFFFISGYLFYNGVGNIKDCFPKIKKRVRSLFVPYITWNIIFVLWFVVLGLIPGVSKFVNSDVVGAITKNGFFNAVYVLFVKPVAFQLWFLRDLILYVAISPLLYYLLNKLGKLFPLLLLLIGTCGLVFLPSEIKLWGVFFFVWGGYVSNYQFGEYFGGMPQWMKIVAGIIYVGYSIINSLGVINLSAVSMIASICGIISIFTIYDFIFTTENKLTKMFAKAGSFSFFVYLFHEPVFNIIKKIGLIVFGHTQTSLIILSIINPLVMMGGAIVVAIVMKKIAPKFYSFLVGGR